MNDAIGLARRASRTAESGRHTSFMMSPKLIALKAPMPKSTRELQSRLSRRRIDPVVLLEEQDAESVEAGVLHAEPIFRLVHAETARSARASRKEDVVVDDILARESLGFEALQVFDQVPDHEIGRIALTVVAELFPELESSDVRRRQQLNLVAGRLKHRSNQPLVLPGQAAKEDRDAVALGRRERPFNRTMKVRALAVLMTAFKPTPFLLDASLNLLLNVLPRLERNRR